MSRSNRPAMRLIGAVIMLVLLNACAVGSALKTQKGADVSAIVPGVPRSEVEQQFGAPHREWTTVAGVHYCLYSRLGDAPADAGVAATWLGMDIVTMGIIEIVPLFTKNDAYERRHQHPMAVAYDSNDRVIGVFPNATEFEDLPVDGRVPSSGKE